MPGGKPAFTPCIHFNAVTRTCEIWMTGEYPDVCRNFTPTPECCGSSREDAIRLLGEMEKLTRP
jgi:hypothetical protein